MPMTAQVSKAGWVFQYGRLKKIPVESRRLKTSINDQVNHAIFTAN